MARNPRRLQDPFDGNRPPVDGRPGPVEDHLQECTISKLAEDTVTAPVEALEIEQTANLVEQPPADGYQEVIWTYAETSAPDAVGSAIDASQPEPESWITLDSVQFGDAGPMDQPDEGFTLNFEE